MALCCGAAGIHVFEEVRLSAEKRGGGRTIGTLLTTYLLFEVIDSMVTTKQSFPLIPRSAIAFKPEFLDFDRGIRVGHLDDNERITCILKLGLEHRFKQPFVTERCW